ncbi:homocysteine S-methyltransferase family protein [Tundrisphaera lichenicola]|uniref:homocysteine S-methyltransferase family protein n=1 Tax=Tundrisphaera lichenicola TaxID=2029860 RepID=UPI003EBD922D
MPATDRFREALDRGPILLDAAMGTRLIARGLDLAVEDPSSWVLNRPDVILDIHRKDVDAGSDAILTNTFGANRAWLARSGQADRAPEINREAARIARIAAGPDRLVLGSIGPTADGDPDALREQAETLIEGGVDALILETHHFDQARSALKILVPESRIPVLASLYRWPDPIGNTAQVLADQGASAIGANCIPGMGPALLIARKLRAACDLPLMVKPSPGRSSPGSFVRAVPRLLALGIRLIGGCCGTDESHVAALRSRILSR